MGFFDFAVKTSHCRILAYQYTVNTNLLEMLVRKKVLNQHR